MPPTENWLSSSPHEPLRSLELVRVAVAVVLVTHPLHALLHPEDAAQLASALAGRGVPWAAGVAFLGLGTLLLAALGLLLRRTAAWGASAAALVVAGGSASLYAPRWFVLGGHAEEGQPGVEFSVLLVCTLVAVAWTWRGRAKAAAEQAAGVGLQIVAIASALLLLPHAASAFVLLDFEGMRSWGEGMSQAGFPHGVPRVWSLKSLELLCCVARLSRRLVVPACLGHLLILVPGMVISQHLAWFNLGPGEGGIEFPVVLSACALATLLAYWPRRSAVTAALPAAAP